jgi:dynein heavy chain
MEHLFTKTGNEAKLASVRKTEKWVKRLYRDIKLRLRAALAPMDEYLSKFAKYKELIALQVDQYVQQFASQEHDLKDVRKLILQHTKEKAKIEKEIPKTVWLGIVLVNCDV